LNVFFLPPCFLWKPFENWGSAPDPAPAGGFFSSFFVPGGRGERREGVKKEKREKRREKERRRRGRRGEGEKERRRERERSSEGEEEKENR